MTNVNTYGLTLFPLFLVVFLSIQHSDISAGNNQSGGTQKLSSSTLGSTTALLVTGCRCLSASLVALCYIQLQSAPATAYSGSLAEFAITWQDSENSFLRAKVINFGSDTVTLTISTSGLQSSVNINALGSTTTVLTSTNVMDENSFSNSTKVVPVKSDLGNATEQMQVTLAPHSLSSFDLALPQSKLVAKM